MKKILFLLASFSSLASSQIFPGRAATVADLGYATDQAVTTLTASITSSALPIPVSSGSIFQPYNILTIDSEKIMICSVSPSQLTACASGRGWGGTTPASHTNGAKVAVYVNSTYINGPTAEIISIESTLLNASNTVLPNYGTLKILPSGFLKVTTGTGALSSVAAPFTLTTSGSSGAATFSGGVLNIPVYTSGGGSGTVTNFSVSSTPAWEVASVSNPTTTPSLVLSGATGLTSHQFVGTCGSSTTAALCSIVSGDLPAIPLSTGVSGLLPVANGGTGTASPSLVAGSNITISGTWPNQTVASTGGGGGAGVLSSLETSVSGTTLTIGDMCTGIAPCNVRVGSTVYAFTAPATASLTSGSGTAYVYVSSGGVLTVGYTGISLSCTVGCTATGSVTAFPTDSFPIATWPATSGAWGSGTDARAPYSRDLVVASTGLTSSLSAGIQTLSVDATVVNSAWPGSLTTTSGTSDTVSIAAVTSSSHCVFSPTNASAAANQLTTYISSVSAGSVTVTHTATSGMTFSLLCSVN